MTYHRLHYLCALNEIYIFIYNQSLSDLTADDILTNEIIYL